LVLARHHRRGRRQWIGSLVAAMARIGLITGLAAMLGGALATLGRNTVAAIIVAWGWLAIGESLVRRASRVRQVAGGRHHHRRAHVVGERRRTSSHSPVGAVAMLPRTPCSWSSGYSLLAARRGGSNLSTDRRDLPGCGTADAQMMRCRGRNRE
jgi:cytochrome b